VGLHTLRVVSCVGSIVRVVDISPPVFFVLSLSLSPSLPPPLSPVVDASDRPQARHVAQAWCPSSRDLAWALIVVSCRLGLPPRPHRPRPPS
jgi:hypothetical protein